MDLLKRAEQMVNKSTMHTAGDLGNAEWTMTTIDEQGYPTARIMGASRADGFNWIAFCANIHSPKVMHIKKNPRVCVCFYDKESYTGISLIGKAEIITDAKTKKHMWFDALEEYFISPEDENWCVLRVIPERYSIFIENHVIRGAL